MTHQQTPPRFKLTEDWLATLIGFGVVLILGAELIDIGAILPWPLFGWFQ